MPAYIYLGFAILAEVVATGALKASDQLTRVGPTIIVVVGYVLSFYLLALALRSIPLGVAYAIWSGVGTAAIAAIGMIAFGEPFTVVRVFWIGVIVVGVVGLQLSSSS